tara:strand:- start:222 stop:428 length:207 start_codon:yes stop_codon:yes gene_type:complete
MTKPGSPGGGGSTLSRKSFFEDLGPLNCSVGAHIQSASLEKISWNFKKIPVEKFFVENFFISEKPKIF